MAEFDALIKRKRADDNRQRLNFGVVSACVLNSAPFGDPNRKPAEPVDFLPKDAAEKHQARPEFDLTKLTPVQQRNYFMSIFMKRTLKTR